MAESSDLKEYALVLWNNGSKKTSIIESSGIKIGKKNGVTAKWGKKFYSIKILRQSNHKSTLEQLKVCTDGRVWTPGKNKTPPDLAAIFEKESVKKQNKDKQREQATTRRVTDASLVTRRNIFFEHDNAEILKRKQSEIETVHDKHGSTKDRETGEKFDSDNESTRMAAQIVMKNTKKNGQDSDKKNNCDSDTENDYESDEEHTNESDEENANESYIDDPVNFVEVVTDGAGPADVYSAVQEYVKMNSKKPFSADKFGRCVTQMCNTLRRPEHEKKQQVKTTQGGNDELEGLVSTPKRADREEDLENFGEEMTKETLENKKDRQKEWLVENPRNIEKPQKSREKISREPAEKEKDQQRQWPVDKRRNGEEQAEKSREEKSRKAVENEVGRQRKTESRQHEKREHDSIKRDGKKRKYSSQAEETEKMQKTSRIEKIERKTQEWSGRDRYEWKKDHWRKEGKYGQKNTRKDSNPREYRSRENEEKWYESNMKRGEWMQGTGKRRRDDTYDRNKRSKHFRK